MHVYYIEGRNAVAYRLARLIGTSSTSISLPSPLSLLCTSAASAMDASWSLSTSVVAASLSDRRSTGSSLHSSGGEGEAYYSGGVHGSSHRSEFKYLEYLKLRRARSQQCAVGLEQRT